MFGIDQTCRFDEQGDIVDGDSGDLAENEKHYSTKPRPLPACLDLLRQSTQNATGETYNFCLVNYYASGSDSISYHSDDEHFLGPNPSIASFSLGETRDFLMKHKPQVGTPVKDDKKPLKLPLAGGDMVLMRGSTQKNWLHSIPKRSGKNQPGGRINITFRKAIVRAGTANYYRYNVGTGPVFRWSSKDREMMPWSRDGD